MSQDQLEAVNFEIGQAIKWLQDRIEYISESAGPPFCIGVYEECLAKLIAIKAGRFANLKNIFDFYDKKVARLQDRCNMLEDKLLDLGIEI